MYNNVSRNKCVCSFIDISIVENMFLLNIITGICVIK